MNRKRLTRKRQLAPALSCAQFCPFPSGRLLAARLLSCFPARLSCKLSPVSVAIVKVCQSGVQIYLADCLDAGARVPPAIVCRPESQRASGQKRAAPQPMLRAPFPDQTATLCQSDATHCCLSLCSLSLFACPSDCAFSFGLPFELSPFGQSFQPAVLFHFSLFKHIRHLLGHHTIANGAGGLRGTVANVSESNSAKRTKPPPFCLCVFLSLSHSGLCSHHTKLE